MVETAAYGEPVGLDGCFLLSTALLCLGSSAVGAIGQRGLSLVSEGQPLLLSGLHLFVPQLMG